MKQSIIERIERMKKPKCPTCGSKNVMLETDLEEVRFYINDAGEIEFDEKQIQEKLGENISVEYVDCECLECGENWGYEE